MSQGSECKLAPHGPIAQGKLENQAWVLPWKIKILNHKGNPIKALLYMETG